MLSDKALRQLADPECKECMGRGLIKTGSDWVPYGDTYVSMGHGENICDCVTEAEAILAEADIMSITVV